MILYFSLLFSCNKSPEPCTSNLNCWQSYGLGFTCSGVDSENTNTEDTTENDLFHYCTVTLNLRIFIR